MEPQNTLFKDNFDAYYFDRTGTLLFKGKLDALPNRGQRIVINGKLYGVHDVATDVDSHDALIRLDILATTGMERVLEPRH
ncbi:MAG: hypothetical protein P4L46_06350 [Fimbriimonas sp.]|nr:hypothetical protein [Fimbriimonas sp.]